MLSFSEATKKILETRKELIGDIERFLNPNYDADLHDPLLFRDMEKAVARVLTAIQNQEKVCVYADFDCDGIPAAVILSDVCEKLGGAVEVYIPHRHNEGYGLHREAVQKIIANGATLIITVDVGITGLEAVQYAQSHGVDVIVTDHHQMGEHIPDAYAVVHPLVGEYPSPHLCGAGVAYKVAQALITYARTHSTRAAEIPEGWEKWLLDMVAIATIADMVPLVGENRTLVSFGLRVLRKSPRPGIRALVKKGRINQAEITEDDIGFVIAPRINAASRMDRPELAFELLTSKTQEEADLCATELERLNAKRKGVVASVVRAAREKVAHAGDVKVAVVGDPSWSPALLGLAANSVLEKRSGAVCLWGRDGRGVLKGSCRSDGSVHITEMFKEAAIELDEAGGHACAGGFSVSHELIHTLQERFSEAAGRAFMETAARHEAIVCTEDDIHMKLFKELQALAPFGVGNEKPVFRLEGVHITSVRIFGKEGNHTELMVQTAKGTLRAYEFFKTPDDFTRVPAPNTYAHIMFTLEKESFGRRGFALRLKDVV